MPFDWVGLSAGSLTLLIVAVMVAWSLRGAQPTTGETVPMNEIMKLLAGDPVKSLGLALAQARFRYDQIAQRWINLSFKLSGLTDVSFLTNVQADGELDVLLRALEDWSAKNVDHPDIPLHGNLQFTLSRAWLLSVYETLRVAVRGNGKDNEALVALFRKVELVRMPLAKGEIAKAKSSKSPIHLVREGDDPQTQSEEYKAGDPSYIPPMTMTPASGSFGWVVVDIALIDSDRDPIRHITRRELSDELLALFPDAPSTPASE